MFKFCYVIRQWIKLGAKMYDILVFMVWKGFVVHKFYFNLIFIRLRIVNALIDLIIL